MPREWRVDDIVYLFVKRWRDLLTSVLRKLDQAND